jgi:hypothetical protein
MHFYAKIIFVRNAYKNMDLILKPKGKRKSFKYNTSDN